MVQSQLQADLVGHQDRVWSLQWSPSGQHLASCSADKTVRIWAANSSSPQEHQTDSQLPLSEDVDQGMKQTWRCVAILEDAHSRTIRSISWSPDGKQLAMASFDATTTVWSRTGTAWEQVAVLEGHENEVKGVAWGPDGCHVATCGRDKSVWIWEALPGYEFECVDVKQGHQQDVKMVAWHPAGQQLVSCSYDDTIKCWVSDGDEWVCTQTLAGSAQGGNGHESTVWAISFNQQGTGLASCSDDCTVKIWAASPAGSQGICTPSWKLAATLSGHHHRTIYSIDWRKCGDSHWIATGDGDNCIRIFGGKDVQQSSSMVDDSSPNAETNKQQQQDAVPVEWVEVACIENAHEADVNCVRWHPSDPGLLASCGDDNLIKLWRVHPA